MDRGLCYTKQITYLAVAVFALATLVCFPAVVTVAADDAATSTVVHPNDVTIVTAAVDVNRGHHYGGETFDFNVDYIGTIANFLMRDPSTKVYLLLSKHKPQDLDALKPHLDDSRGYVRLVDDVGKEFPLYDAMEHAYTAAAADPLDPTSCGDFTFQRNKFTKLQAVYHSKLYWMREAARLNPFNTTYFLWLDLNRRCHDMILPPLQFDILTPSLRSGKFFAIVARQWMTQFCNGNIPPSEYAAGLVRQPDQLLRAMLMGGKAESIENVTTLFEDQWMQALSNKRHYATEEQAITRLYHTYPDIFTTMRSYDNFGSHNLEIHSCFAVSRISANRFDMWFVYPAEGQTFRDGRGAIVAEVAMKGFRRAQGQLCWIVVHADSGEPVVTAKHNEKDGAYLCGTFENTAQQFDLVPGSYMILVEWHAAGGLAYTSSITRNITVEPSVVTLAPGSSHALFPSLADFYSHAAARSGSSGDGPPQAMVVGGSKDVIAFADDIAHVNAYGTVFASVAMSSPSDDSVIGASTVTPQGVTTLQSAQTPTWGMSQLYGHRVVWLGGGGGSDGVVSAFADGSLAFVYIANGLQTMSQDALFSVLATWFQKVQPGCWLAGNSFYDGSMLDTTAYPHKVGEVHVESTVNRFAHTMGVFVQRIDFERESIWVMERPQTVQALVLGTHVTPKTILSFVALAPRFDLPRFRVTAQIDVGGHSIEYDATFVSNELGLDHTSGAMIAIIVVNDSEDDSEDVEDEFITASANMKGLVRLGYRFPPTIVEVALINGLSHPSPLGSVVALGETKIASTGSIVSVIRQFEQAAARGGGGGGEIGAHSLDLLLDHEAYTLTYDSPVIAREHHCTTVLLIDGAYWGMNRKQDGTFRIAHSTKLLLAGPHGEVGSVVHFVVASLRSDDWQVFAYSQTTTKRVAA